MELFLNGQSLGRKACGKATGYITCFETTYQPGALEAICYDGETESGRMTLETSGSRTHLDIQTEKAVSDELVYLTISSLDENGKINPSSSDSVTVTAEGALQTWVGSGNPKPLDHYLGTQTSLWNGRALLIVRRTADRESVRIQISSASETIQLEV